MKGQLLLNLQPQEKFVSRETIVRLLCMQIKQEVGQTQTLSLVTAYEFISLFLSSCLPSAPGFSLFLPLNDAHLSLSSQSFTDSWMNSFSWRHEMFVEHFLFLSVCLSFPLSSFLQTKEGNMFQSKRALPSSFSCLFLMSCYRWISLQSLSNTTRWLLFNIDFISYFNIHLYWEEHTQRTVSLSNTPQNSVIQTPYTQRHYLSLRVEQREEREKRIFFLKERHKWFPKITIVLDSHTHCDFLLLLISLFFDGCLQQNEWTKNTTSDWFISRCNSKNFFMDHPRRKIITTWIITIIGQVSEEWLLDQQHLLLFIASQLMLLQETALIHS